MRITKRLTNTPKEELSVLSDDYTPNAIFINHNFADLCRQFLEKFTRLRRWGRWNDSEKPP